ncbi:MAG: ABC transporter ATP-binding protein, partial [Chloroflexi bacterium]|nr:ABC transporter ATP-binding protein [Chloroflexota bacterium]
KGVLAGAMRLLAQLRSVVFDGHTAAVLEAMHPHFIAYRWRFAAVLALLPASAASAALVPFLLKVAVDDYLLPAVAAGDVEPWRAPLLALVALASAVVAVGYLADALYVRILQRTGHRLLAALRETVYRHTLRLPRSYFDRNPIGSVLTRVTSDVEALGESFAGNVLALFVDLLKTFAFLGMMFWLSWQATLVLLTMLPLLLVVMRFFQLRVRTSFFRARQALSDATAYLQECLAGMKTVQLYAAEMKVHAAFERRNRRFYEAQNTSNFYDAMLYALVDGLTSLSLAVVLWYAAGALLTGVMTLGVLVAFMEYIQRLFVPVRELSQQLAILQRALAALDHIGGLLVEPLDPAEPVQPMGKATVPADALQRTAGTSRFDRLDLEKVRFRYSPGGPEVLRGVDLSVRRGETVAIVGATGSGKSSIVRVATRAYGGYEGSVRLNGREVTTLDADEIGEIAAVVHQNVFLFPDSIAFNITLDRSDRQTAIWAAKHVHIDEFICELPGGYDFKVAHGGANLSAGQAQLIAFARAVATRKDLIVLDEATSSVDSTTEEMVELALARLFETRTVIAIAHRLSTIREADRIVVLDAGRVVETGTHRELSARGGAYARLLGESLDVATPHSGTR